MGINTVGSKSTGQSKSLFRPVLYPYLPRHKDQRQHNTYTPVNACKKWIHLKMLCINLFQNGKLEGCRVLGMFWGGWAGNGRGKERQNKTKHWPKNSVTNSSRNYFQISQSYNHSSIHWWPIICHEFINVLMTNYDVFQLMCWLSH